MPSKSSSVNVLDVELVNASVGTGDEVVDLGDWSGIWYAGCCGD